MMKVGCFKLKVSSVTAFLPGKKKSEVWGVYAREPMGVLFMIPVRYNTGRRFRTSCGILGIFRCKSD